MNDGNGINRLQPTRQMMIEFLTCRSPMHRPYQENPRSYTFNQSAILHFSVQTFEACRSIKWQSQLAKTTVCADETFAENIIEKLRHAAITFFQCVAYLYINRCIVIIPLKRASFCLWSRVSRYDYTHRKLRALYPPVMRLYSPICIGTFQHGLVSHSISSAPNVQ